MEKANELLEGYQVSMNTYGQTNASLERAETGGLLHDDSDRVSRMISTISNDSIRQLIKIASIGIEEQLSLDDIDLTEFCEGWDVPLGPDLDQMPTSPTGFQMEVDAMQKQIHLHDMGSEYVDMSHYDTGIPSAMTEPKSYPTQMPSYEPPSLQHTMPEIDISRRYNERPMMHSMEQRGTPEMDVQRPRINLVLDSNVVMLDSRACPKPSVTVLPSQVIHAPDHPSPTSNSSTHALQGYDGGLLSNADYSWSRSMHPQNIYDSLPMYDPRCPPDFTQNIGNSTMNAVNCKFSQMMMVENMDNPFMMTQNEAIQLPLVMDPATVDERQQLVAESNTGDERAGKVVRKNTRGEKLPVEEKPLSYKTEDLISSDRKMESHVDALGPSQIESRSAELHKIESMTEAEICEYVKSMAPQLQNSAWEEVVGETDFEERLSKAEQKMQEHNHEMERIRKEIESGHVDQRTGQELLRKVYNRREAAASRTKREQALVKAAIKKRTLEKICHWMREHLIGHSDLFRTTSKESEVRRSRSDCMKTCP